MTWWFSASSGSSGPNISPDTSPPCRRTIGRSRPVGLEVHVEPVDCGVFASAACSVCPVSCRHRHDDGMEPHRHTEGMSALPSGTVTFVFSDIEGSTSLLKALGDGYGDVLSDHRKLMRESFTTRGGVEIDTQGDAFFFAFPRARDAISAAVEAQRLHDDTCVAGRSQVRVRMGLHTGEPAIGSEGYLGIDVVRAARLCTVGRGGQVLLSETTRALVGSSLPDGVSVHTLGERHLKDIDEPERVFELDIEGAPAPAAPVSTVDAAAAAPKAPEATELPGLPDPPSAKPPKRKKNKGGRRLRHAGSPNASRIMCGARSRSRWSGCSPRSTLSPTAPQSTPRRSPRSSTPTNCWVGTRARSWASCRAHEPIGPAFGERHTAMPTVRMVKST